jgi:two-component system cell cycle sensor histidine kinase/response regulator CckA
MRSTEAAELSVLVVDDDSQLLRTLSDILRLNGYRPTTASNAKDGLALADLDAPVIALVDLRLPDMDGMELVTRLKATSENIEVVILTGNASVDSAVSALRQQSFDYLIKPVRPEDLFRTLERAGERFHRKRAEAALRESEEQMQRIFAAVNDGLLITDASGCIVQSNPAASRIAGVLPEELLGVQMTTLLRPLSQEASVRQTPVGEDGEFHLIRPGGETRHVEAAVAAFAPDRLVHTIRDVTEQRQMQDQLRVAQKMEALGRLAGGVAHDFNNVLTAIRGYADLVRERCTEPDMAADVDEIRKAASRASDLTRQLLAFSRRQVLQPRVLDLDELLSGLEGMLRRLIREDIVLTLEVSHAPGRVRADVTQLEQVVLNLVVNARDAMPEGGVITIGAGIAHFNGNAMETLAPAAPAGDYAFLRVSDTGMGIPPEVLPHLFEPFFTTKDVGQGTGLGLSTVHGIVQQLGGFVRVEPRVSGGTSFVIFLPQEDAEPEISVPLPLAAARVSTQAEHILVAEDDPAIRRMILHYLGRNGYTVRAASNASEVLSLLSSGEKIDLLLTDLVLPGVSGWDIARMAAQMQPGVRVLYMSGYAETDIGGAILAPGVAFIPKPFTASELNQKIRAILDGIESARTR